MHHFERVKVDSLVKGLAITGLVLALMFGWALLSPASVAQTPRPTLTPTPAPTVTPAPTIEAQAASGYSGPNLRGRVIDLSRNEPVEGATVVFDTGEIAVEAVTDKDGKYAFELGATNGVLNVVPLAGSGLKPVTADVAVQPRGGVETVVNLGVSPNGSAAPPIIPTVEVSPAWVRAQENLTVTVFIKNTLPKAISGAMVTYWLPTNLRPVDIRSSTGNPFFNDNLAIVEVGRLDLDSGALVEIVAQATDGQAVAAASRRRASFFFREDAAAQARVMGSVNGSSPTVLPVTGVGVPLIGLLLVVVVIVIGWLRRRLGHTVPAN